VEVDMSNVLDRLGRWVADHHRAVLALGFVAILAVVGADRFAGGEPVDDFSVPGVESQQALDLLAERFEARAGATAMVVFHTDSGSVTDAAHAGTITETVREVEGLDHVASVTDPLGGPRSISPDQRTAFAAVQYDASTKDVGHDGLDALVATAPSEQATGVQVSYGGELPTVLKEHSEGPGEMIGVLVALVILMVALRSVVSAGTPIIAALIGLVTGLSLVGLVGALVDIPSIALRLATMIGLGVGIDYALFVLSRHRDQLAEGMDLRTSIGRTNATAGAAVVVAGGTVVVAILGLGFAGVPFVAALGWAASIVVAVAVLVAVTLLPAVLRVAGARVLPRSARALPARSIPSASSTANDPVAAVPADKALRASPGHEIGEPTELRGWMRWAHAVAHRPWPAAVGATVVLVVMATPLLGMRLGQVDAGTDPASMTQRKAYDLLAVEFGPGFNGPLLVAVDLTEATDRGVLDDIATALRDEPGVRAVAPPETNKAGDTALFTVVPTSAPQDEATSDLVHRLRDDVLPTATADTGAEALVGGPTAGFIDQSDRIAQRLGWFIAGVVALSFVLLLIVFRSILVPVTAAMMNLLSIGAAYGVVVAVFQWGWGREFIGLAEAVPIASFVPMMMFAILFGLSMDYQVFILSRIREEYHAGHTNIASVVVGLGATAKVITAAALIMIGVFVGFVASDDPVVKMMGIGLATAVAVDATIVRMILVPAVMSLIGDANWWLPRWLDRVLPDIDLEGRAIDDVVEGTVTDGQNSDTSQSGTAPAPASDTAV
jgi:RND superfamily putative drug exporter